MGLRTRNAIGGRTDRAHGRALYPSMNGREEVNENPFRNITTRPISAEQRAYLESEGINMRIYEQTRIDERNRRIDDEYKKQVKNLRLDLAEKYPLANQGNFTSDRRLLSQGQEQTRAFTRELNQGIKRLKRLAAAAKRK